MYREGAREVARELHRVRAVLVRVKGEREGGRRGEVHGVEDSGELGQDSGERFPGKGSFSWLTEASTRCARRRRGSGQDGDGLGELEQPEQPTPSRCWCGRWWRRALRLLLVLEARERSGGVRRSAVRSGKCRRDRRGAGQAGGAARRAHRRMADTRCARSDAAGRMRGGWAWHVGAGA